MVALYFVLDCGVAVYQWQLQEVRTWEIYVDSGLDFTFYVYYLVRAILALQRQQEALELRAQEENMAEDDFDYVRQYGELEQHPIV